MYTQTWLTASSRLAYPAFFPALCCWQRAPARSPCTPAQARPRRPFTHPHRPHPPIPYTCPQPRPRARPLNQSWSRVRRRPRRLPARVHRTYRVHRHPPLDHGRRCRVHRPRRPRARHPFLQHRRPRSLHPLPRDLRRPHHCRVPKSPRTRPAIPGPPRSPKPRRRLNKPQRLQAAPFAPLRAGRRVR